MTGESIAAKNYRVKLGFTEVFVEGSSKEEAIRHARKKLSDDMPRLYDVIYQADDIEFQVNEVHESPNGV